MSLLTTPRPVVVRRDLPARFGRRARLSARVDLRVLALVAIVAALALAVAAWTMTLGDVRIPLGDLVATTLGFGDGRHDFVVRTLRLPRTLAAALVGAALASSGALFQALVRNPLVAPDVVGVNAGASLAAVFLIVTSAGTTLVPAGALAGALAATAALYALAWRNGIAGHRLVLVGIGLHAIATALTTLLIVRHPIEQVSSAVLWLTGTLYATDWSDVLGLVLGLAVLLPVALASLPSLRILALGDDSSRALGSRVDRARAGALAVAAALAAVAVAVAGPLAFVALLTPHVARMLAGPLTAGVLLLAAALGALLVLASDLVAQHAFSPLSLPVGAITAAVGAPYFLFLLYRSNRAA
jgi:iron complex transport system permease protein